MLAHYSRTYQLHIVIMKTILNLRKPLGHLPRSMPLTPHHVPISHPAVLVTSPSTCAFTTLCVALGSPTFSGLESHSNIIFISKPGSVTRPSTTTTSFLIIWSTGSCWGTCWEICQPQAFSQPLASLRMRIRYIACAAAGSQPRCAQVLISWMWSAMACGRAMPSGST